jgi:RNA polymerase sigma-70 factor (ECF subfamily)
MPNNQAFIQMIQSHELIILKITRAYALDKEDQKDLYQEVVYQLWKSFSSFRGDSKQSTWVYRIALNTSITHQKKNKRRRMSPEIEAILQEKLSYVDFEKEERIRLLYDQIKQLNLVNKGIILLFLEGKSYEEIAQITGFTATNIGTRLARIKQKIRSTIKIN